MKKLNERLGHYVPPRETWTPADEAVYKPIDLCSVPLDEARTMQLKAIRYAFARHYKLNYFYRRYCEMRGINTDDIKTYDDLEKIPLIPDLTFKQHPSGLDFAHWIANIYTGELPTVVFENANPTFEEVINTFNAAGMVITYSSGTSGQHTVIPRDMRTFMNLQYGNAKAMLSVFDLAGIEHFLAFWPNPTKTNLVFGRALVYYSKLIDDLRYALDFEISADMTLRAMSDTTEREHTSPSAEERLRHIVEIGVKWLENYEKSTDTFGLGAAPFMLVQLMDTLERTGKRFTFGERGLILTGGGWKISEDKRLSAAEFRMRVEEQLGFPKRAV